MKSLRENPTLVTEKRLVYNFYFYFIQVFVVCRLDIGFVCNKLNNRSYLQQVKQRVFGLQIDLSNDE